MRTALSITGTNFREGAGIQANLITLAMNGVRSLTGLPVIKARGATGVTSNYFSTLTRCHREGERE